MSSAKPRVAIIMGSDSDLPAMELAETLLQEFKIAYEIAIVSAHRTPRFMQSWATKAKSRGIQIIIAGAGGRPFTRHGCLFNSSPSDRRSHPSRQTQRPRRSPVDCANA